MAKEPAELRRLTRNRSRVMARGHLPALQELTEVVQGQAPLLPAGPPCRHQDRLRFRTGPSIVSKRHASGERRRWDEAKSLAVLTHLAAAISFPSKDF